MSTGRKNDKIPVQAGRIAQLSRMGEEIFYVDDLARMWHIIHKNTLYTTLKRYVQQGILFRIYKGLYSSKPLAELDPLLLGRRALHGYAYVSTETILSQHGTILQQIPWITFIGQVSRKFAIGSNQYHCRKLSDQYLYQTIGIEDVNGVTQATLSRAVSDMLFFNPLSYFDAPQFIDWKEVKKIQKILNYPLTPNRYDDSSKPKRRNA